MAPRRSRGPATSGSSRLLRLLAAAAGMLLASCLGGSSRGQQWSFAPPALPRLHGPSPAAARGRGRHTALAASESGGFLGLEAFEPMASAVLESPYSAPMIRDLKEQGIIGPVTMHWAHAVGGSLLFLYAGYAIYLGWQIRLGNGGKVFPMSYDQTASERHPYMMGLVLLFLVFEIPDGLTLMAADNQQLLHSTHASTAVLSLALMTLVAGLGLAAGFSKTARDAHAYGGSAVALLLLGHAYFGVALGWSL